MDRLEPASPPECSVAGFPCRASAPWWAADRRQEAVRAHSWVLREPRHAAPLLEPPLLEMVDASHQLLDPPALIATGFLGREPAPEDEKSDRADTCQTVHTAAPW